MDPLLAALMGSTTPDDSQPVPAPKPKIGMIPADEITVIGANYWENPENKGSWIESKTTFTLQFFTQTEPFTPHYNDEALACWAQMHDPDYVSSYVGDYKEENEGLKSVPTDGQMRWLNDLINQTVTKYPGALIGQLYHKKGGGTTYLWGNVVRMRIDKYGMMKLDVFLHEKLFNIIDVIEPNQDKNPNTVKIKLRGRHDPHLLWTKKFKRKAKP